MDDMEVRLRKIEDTLVILGIEFKNVKAIVYGAVGLILTTVLLSIVALVVKSVQ